MPPLSPLADRRAVLRLLAAGAAAALASCSKPDQPIYPRAGDAEGAEPGRTRRYATALPLAGYARGLTGLVVDGRPIKLEGLADHPASLGATDLFAEAAILDLYDPQRLRAPTFRGEVASWTLLQRELLGRLAGSDGRDLRLLTGRVTSPTLLARIAAMKARFPAMRHVRAEPIDDDAAREGARAAFGRVLTMRPRLAEADVVAALDADFLGPGPEQIALARAWSRRRLAPGGPQRLHVLEPSLTQTGICADRRTPTTPGRIADALLAIARALGAEVATPALPEPVAHAVAAIARDLRGARGRAIVLIGGSQPAPVHALAAWVNARLGAPADWIAPVDAEDAGHAASLAGLAREMHAGRVGTLVMLDVNPLYHAPAALGFGEALAQVPLSLAVSRFPSETAAAARWTAPLSDPLESWEDLRAANGTASVAQPLIRPLYDTRAAAELLDLIDPPQRPRAAYDRLRDQWLPHANGDAEAWWRDLLVRGVVPGTAAVPVVPPAPRLAPYPPSSATHGLTLTIAPSPTVWDGRFAGNAWAQECPDPITKEVWGSSLRLSAPDAAALELGEGALVRVGSAGTAAVRIVAGQAPGVATLLAGYGRQNSGAIAGTAGVNAFALRRDESLSIVPTGEERAVPSTQAQFALEGEQAKLFPVVAPGGAVPRPKPQPTLLPPHSPAPGPQWAMTIDTSVCIGCNACVVACQAENNVPAIGPDEIARGRDMHWLRVDLYAHDDGAGFQPVPCMQCETAPCEPVCPVEASVHDTQGLNLQVYNRCVGTRTCQANCPYKVRRFNFHDYAGANLWDVEDQASVTAQRNPEVTVRARGVMEKCTYCVQRIETARAEADAAGRPIGEVRTACQSACPTSAIRFGDLTDPHAQVVRDRQDPRHYGLLEELGTRPRTTYLAKVRDA